MRNLQQIPGIPTSVCVLLFSFALRLLLFWGASSLESWGPQYVEAPCMGKSVDMKNPEEFSDCLAFPGCLWLWGWRRGQREFGDCFVFHFCWAWNLFPWDLRWFQLLEPEALHTLLEPTFALLGGTFYHGVLSFQPVFFWFVSIGFPSRLSRMLKNQAFNRREPLCAGVSYVLNTLLGSLHPLILHWSFIYPVHIYQTLTLPSRHHGCRYGT